MVLHRPAHCMVNCSFLEVSTSSLPPLVTGATSCMLKRLAKSSEPISITKERFHTGKDWSMQGRLAASQRRHIDRVYRNLVAPIIESKSCTECHLGGMPLWPCHEAIVDVILLWVNIVDLTAEYKNNPTSSAAPWIWRATRVACPSELLYHFR